MGKPLQIQLNSTSIFPSWQHSNNWMALTAVMLGFAGMELASVHIKDVQNPQRTFPKALAFSTIIILITMMLGSLAIACVLPYDQINLVNGTIQTFSYFLSAYHLHGLVPILTILLVVGSLGGVINWVISPIKGLNQAAQHGFMPAFFQQKNKYGVPQNLLIGQGVLVSFTCTAFLLMPTINASYWLLTTLTTQLYMLMYVILFLSGFRLRHKIHYPRDTFVIPGKKFGSRCVCLLGLMGCVITLVVGFIPPTYVNIGSSFQYEMLVCSGMLGLIAPILFFYWYQAYANIPAMPAVFETDDGDPNLSV
jgi:amino acid transporter